jgi:hypothetical protein
MEKSSCIRGLSYWSSAVMGMAKSLHGSVVGLDEAMDRALLSLRVHAIRAPGKGFFFLSILVFCCC